MCTTSKRLTHKSQSEKRHKTLSSEQPAVDPSVLSFEDFVLKLKRLCNFCGINPDAVDKKVPATNPDDVSDATLTKFREAEERCLETNLFLMGMSCQDLIYKCSSGGLSPTDVLGYAEASVFDTQIASLLDMAIDELNDLICKDFNVDTEFYFGPGAAGIWDRSSNELITKLDSREYSVPNDRFDPFSYFSDEALITRPFDGDVDERYDPLASLAFHISESVIGQRIWPDKICQVPKTRVINRSIGVGSVVGIAAQHVVGTYIEKCLRRRGLDIKSLAKKHKDMAMAGSMQHHTMMTIDFSQASDSLSFGLIWMLFYNKRSSKRCKTLFQLMVNCRSDFYRIDGENTGYDVYEKMSAMGNGFTFPLETVVFTAFGRAFAKIVRSKYCRTYNIKPSSYDDHFRAKGATCGLSSSFGDDLIIWGPSRITKKLFKPFVELLAILGLTINSEKSFVEGDFRESCGADYHDGRFVRSFYLHTNRVLFTDVIRAWNFFRLYYDVPELLLSSNAFFGGVIRRYRMFRVAFDQSHCESGSCLKHDIRVPQDRLISQIYEGDYVFREMVPSRARVHEIDSICNVLMPCQVGRPFTLWDVDVTTVTTEPSKTLGIIQDDITVATSYFRLVNRYHSTFDGCLISKRKLREKYAGYDRIGTLYLDN